MMANTIASAVPTPGGVGAIEAALVAVLTGLGVDSGYAWSIVLIFRLVTYWGTIPPSWFFLWTGPTSRPRLTVFPTMAGAFTLRSPAHRPGGQSHT